MGGSSDSRIEYAKYLQDIHYDFLSDRGTRVLVHNLVDIFDDTIGASPYGGYSQIDVDDGYLGTGYTVSNFPSLWDMFGKFMAGLDVHDLWGQVYEDVIRGPEIENVVSAQSALIQDDIDTTVMPKFLSGMRDINSVQATSFVMGKAIIQDAHVKSINKFSTQIRMHAIDIANDQWTKHLDWNKSVINTFSEMFKLYYSSRLDMDRVNLEYQAKDNMWDINLFENARAFLGALGGTSAISPINEPSQTQKTIGGAMTGAAAGYQAYGYVGAAVGGVLGAAASYL